MAREEAEVKGGAFTYNLVCDQLAPSTLLIPSRLLRAAHQSHILIALVEGVFGYVGVRAGLAADIVTMKRPILPKGWLEQLIK